MKSKGNYFFIFILWMTLAVFIATFIITLVLNPLDDDGWFMRLLASLLAALIMTVTPWALVAMGWRMFTKDGRAQFRKEEQERELKRWEKRNKMRRVSWYANPFSGEVYINNYYDDRDIINSDDEDELEAGYRDGYKAGYKAGYTAMFGEDDWKKCYEDCMLEKEIKAEEKAAHEAARAASARAMGTVYTGSGNSNYCSCDGDCGCSGDCGCG